MSAVSPAAWVRDRGAVGVIAFILAYAGATVLAVPGSLLTLAAGAIFGIVEGTASCSSRPA